MDGGKVPQRRAASLERHYLPLEGRLPRDRDRIVATVDRALAGAIRPRPEWARGL